MAVTSGFFNSKNHDRRYDALQMGQIFDGIIRDGVLQFYGNSLRIIENEGMMISVDTGRAWFNHTWTYNDALLPLQIAQSELILDRIDAVVLDVDLREETRANDIIVISGEPASTPQKPTLINNGIDHFQYPLAYIYVKQEVTELRQADIENTIGTEDCPFVTAPLDKVSVDDLLAQWQDSFKEWEEDRRNEFDAWFYTIEDVLSGNVAGNLQLQLNRMTRLRTATLRASDWSEEAPYTQTVDVIGIIEGDSPFIQCIGEASTASEKKILQKQWNYLDSVEVYDDYILAICNFEKPTIDLPILIKGR